MICKLQITHEDTRKVVAKKFSAFCVFSSSMSEDAVEPLNTQNN